VARPPNLRAQFPSGPLLDETGEITPVWRAYFAQLYERTGGPQGSSVEAVLAALALERTARINGDTTLTNAITAERTARENADTALGNAIAAERNARQAADIAETMARIAADALLVPIAQLCSMWAGCNLSFLPTTDPGNGRPWLDGTHIVVGTPTTSVVGLGLEDGSGAWALEDGSGHWIWG
jgi:hypothetical protein